MALAGALTLVVPVIGWQSVRQLNESLVQTRVDAQRLTATHLQLAIAEAREPELAAILERGASPRVPAEIYAGIAPRPLVVDGYADDWRSLNTILTYYPDDKTRVLSVRAAERRQRLYLLVEVQDDELTWHRPPRIVVDAGENEAPAEDRFIFNGDALELWLLRDGAVVKHVVTRAIAPGPVNALHASEQVLSGNRRVRRGTRAPEVRAAWQQRKGGYQVELSLPVSDATPDLQLALVLHDFDRGGGLESRSSIGSIHPRTLRRTLMPSRVASVPRLYRASQAANDVLAARITAGNRARLFDGAGRLLADVDRLNERREDAVGTSRFENIWDALLFRLFAWLVAGDLPLPAATDVRALPVHLDPRAEMTDSVTRRYVTPNRDRVLGTVLPIGGVKAQDQDAMGTAVRDTEPQPAAWLWFESNEEHSSAYTGSQLARLFSLLILASLIAVLVLFAWGTWLSLRISRLARAASLAVTEDGRPGDAPLQPSRSHDELGSLSRDLASLLGRSADYNRYLETLSRYLSHELRTPLSVVRSSLENLKDTDLADDSRALLMRAAGGTDELDRIIAAIVESTRLEQAIEQAERVAIDLDGFVDNCVQRYTELYPDSIIERRSAATPLPDSVTHVVVAPDLLIQALDKLVDNAIEYARTEYIQIVLEIEHNNNGSHFVLAVANSGAPVNTVVAGEEASKGTRHMGLGLYIVRMIAEAHGGRLYVDKESDGPIVGLTLRAQCTGRH